MTPTLGYWARKLLHFILNGAIAAAILFVPSDYVKPLLVAGFICILVFESFRLKTEAKKYVNDAVGTLFKLEEGVEYSGLFWGSLGALIIALFAEPIAISFGFAILALCDSFASMVGRLLDHRPFYRNKTLPGSITCFVCALVVSFIFVLGLSLPLPLWPFCFAVAAIITFVEVFSFPFDDNFTVIVTAAFLMHFALRFL